MSSKPRFPKSTQDNRVSDRQSVRLSWRSFRQKLGNYRRWVTGVGAPNVRSGSLADKPSRAKIEFCPLWSKSGQIRARLDCPLSATSGQNERGRQLKRPLARTLKYVARCDQYDRDQDDDHYRHLTGGAVKKATLFRVTGLHCHNYLLG
jgi:hypothetical protein